MGVYRDEDPVMLAGSNGADECTAMEVPKGIGRDLIRQEADSRNNFFVHQCHCTWGEASSLHRQRTTGREKGIWWS